MSVIKTLSLFYKPQLSLVTGKEAHGVFLIPLDAGQDCVCERLRVDVYFLSSIFVAPDSKVIDSLMWSQ